MIQDSKKGLAQVVRGLRELHGITQEELGRAAGYRTGAGVAISRLESGLLRPGDDKLAGIAKTLGLTPEELAARAAKPIAEDLAAAAEAGGTANTASGRSKAPPGQKELNARKNMIEHETGERAKAITELGEAFNQAHDRARDEFFMRFVEIAARVEGAPPLETTQLEDDGATDADPGTASTGAAISGLPGIATTNATLALLGGTMVLAGIASLPAAILFGGGLAGIVKRNRRERQEFDAQLSEAEAQLAAARPGIEALKDILPRAVVTLDYIATHAGHAVSRWEDQFGSGTIAWDSLGQAGQRRYQDFVEIADAQTKIEDFGFQRLLITKGSDQEQLIQLADELLTQSHDIVKARV